MAGDDVYQRVVEALDIEAALVPASKRNDLLLPRPDDDVGGNVGKRFSEALKRELQEGLYEPERIHFVGVPKSVHATRPAALMPLSDRVVYLALVEPLRLRIEKALPPKSVLLWPRATPTPKSWPAFEKAPLQAVPQPPSHIIRADIAGFYDSIDHERLADTLVTLTGRREVVAALVEFLGRAMGRTRGVPQGIDVSDVLATAYLSTVDLAMVRGGHEYVRHGDDMRISCPDYSAARRALVELEAEVRTIDLQLNGSKSSIVRCSSYENDLKSVDGMLAKAYRQAQEALVKDLVDEGDDALTQVLIDNDLTELGWNFFYHQSVTLEELIERVREVIKPNDVDRATKVFELAFAERPGTGSLDAETFHVLVTMSLVQLSAVRSPAAVEQCPDLLFEFPDKAGLVAQYLLALCDADSTPVAAALQRVLDKKLYQTGWETAWLLRVASALKVDNKAITAHAMRIATDEESPWMSRVEAAKVLARRNALTPILARRLWSRAPAVFRADIIEALVLHVSCDWRDAFLATVRSDAVYNVVIEHNGRRHNAAAPT